MKISRMTLPKGPTWIVKLLREAGLAASNSEARRLIEQGAVRIATGPLVKRKEMTVIRDVNYQVMLTGRIVVNVGKLRWAVVELERE